MLKASSKINLFLNVESLILMIISSLLVCCGVMCVCVCVCDEYKIGLIVGACVYCACVYDSVRASVCVSACECVWFLIFFLEWGWSLFFLLCLFPF